MKDVDEDFSELVVLPAIDDDVHTGVQDKEEVGKVRENSAPEDKNIEIFFGNKIFATGTRSHIQALIA